MAVLDQLKRLLGSPGSAGSAGSAGQEQQGTTRSLGKPPRPPRGSRPKQPSAPQVMQNSAPKASPGHPAGRAVPHCDQQDLERLRNQFGELEQQLAVLPLRIHLPANGQLLEKLGGGSPAAHGIKAPSYCSSTSEEAVLEPDSTSSRATCWATSQHDRGDTTAAEAGAKPLQTVSKLCMLARQRHRPDAGALPSAANNLTDWGPIQAAPRQWEHALTTPRVLEEAAARMQPRVAVKEQLQRLANDAALARPKAAGAPPSAHILADTEPTMSAAGAAVSACETDARRAEARAPASLHHPGSAGKHPEKDLASTQSYVDARPAGGAAHTGPPRSASPPLSIPWEPMLRGGLPADLLSLRESASLGHSNGRSPSPQGVIAGSAGSSSGDEAPTQQGPRAVVQPGHVSDATRRLLAVRRRRSAGLASHTGAPPNIQQAQPARSATSSPESLCKEDGDTHAQPQRGEEQITPKSSKAAQVPLPDYQPPKATGRAHICPAPRFKGHQPKPASRPSPAMLKQHQAWGGLAGLTLEELLTKGPATTNDGVAQDDQENLPSPDARTRSRADNPVPLQLSPSTQQLEPAASKLLGKPRRRTDPVGRAASEDADVLNRLQRLHTEGSLPSSEAGIQWSRPASKRPSLADTAAPSVTGQSSGMLSSESSWQAVAASTTVDRPTAAHAFQLPMPGVRDRDGGSHGSVAVTRRRRGTWNFAQHQPADRMVPLPEHAAIDGTSFRANQEWQQQQEKVDARHDQGGAERAAEWDNDWAQPARPRRRATADVPPNSSSQWVVPMQGPPQRQSLSNELPYSTTERPDQPWQHGDQDVRGSTLPSLHSPHHGWQGGHTFSPALPSYHMQQELSSQHGPPRWQQLPPVGPVGHVVLWPDRATFHSSSHAGSGVGTAASYQPSLQYASALPPLAGSRH